LDVVVTQWSLGVQAEHIPIGKADGIFRASIVTWLPALTRSETIHSRSAVQAFASRTIIVHGRISSLMYRYRRALESSLTQYRRGFCLRKPSDFSTNAR
jgi:hypothetical protein